MKLPMNCHNKYLFCKFILLINFAEDIQNMISQRIGFIGASIIYFFLSYNSKFSQYSNLLKPNVVSVIPACYQFVKKLCQLLASANIDRIFPHSVQIWENTDQKILNTDAFHAVQVTKDFIQSVQNFSLSKTV